MHNEHPIVHFTYHNVDEFIEELGRRGVDTLFRSRNNKRIHFRGITEDCRRMFSFVEDMPGFEGNHSYGSSRWKVDDNGYAVYETSDRRTLSDELVRLKVNGDQLATFRRSGKSSLEKKVAVACTHTSNSDEDVEEKSIKKTNQKICFTFDREGEEKPVLLHISMSDKSYGEPSLSYKIKIAPLDSSQIAKLDELLREAGIKLIKGSVDIKRF